MVRIMVLATNLLKLTLLAGCIATPFWAHEDRLQPGTQAFAVGGDGHRTGDKMTVIMDRESGPVSVVWESGERGEISREKIHPIDFTVRP